MRRHLTIAHNRPSGIDSGTIFLGVSTNRCPGVDGRSRGDRGLSGGTGRDDRIGLGGSSDANRAGRDKWNTKARRDPALRRGRRLQ